MTEADMGWFLYDIGLRLERFKGFQLLTIVFII